MAGETGTGGHRPRPARQAAGCPVPGTTNRLFLKKFAKDSRNNSAKLFFLKFSGNLVKILGFRLLVVPYLVQQIVFS
jgi:hypothetical protein